MESFLEGSCAFAEFCMKAETDARRWSMVHARLS